MLHLLTSLFRGVEKISPTFGSARNLQKTFKICRRPPLVPTAQRPWTVTKFVSRSEDAGRERLLPGPGQYAPALGQMPPQV
jgi:hypothetical protein